MSRIEQQPNKSTHKAMDFSPEFRMSPDMKCLNDADLSLGGGIILNDEQPILFVRGPFWRRQMGDPIVRENDVKRIYISSRHPNYSEISGGAELELFAWSPSHNDMYPLMSPNSSIIRELEENNATNGTSFRHANSFLDESPSVLNFSDELMQQCIEVNFLHHPDGKTRSIAQLIALKKLAKITKRHSVLLTPISSLPNRPLEKDDVSADSYVRRIALDHMGWENVRHFIGSSFQTHVEMFDPKVGLKSINYLQQTTPVLLAISSSGPFVNGRVFINNEDMPGMNSERHLWHSVRYLGRKWGSPSGGVIEFPAPNKIEGYLEIANQRLMSQDIPTIARGLGHHTDFRLRLDIEPWGTIELATPDTFGAHPLKLAAFGEFMKALTMKIQTFIYENREQDLPKYLFGKLDEVMLGTIERDSISVSQFGVLANLHTPQGNTTRAQEQFLKLLSWVAQPEPQINFWGLPNGVSLELLKAAEIVTEETFNMYTTNGKLTLAGFYHSGLGTLSQWLHRKAFQLLEEGKSEKHAIEECMTELGTSFHEYLSQEVLGQKIVQMFST